MPSATCVTSAQLRFDDGRGRGIIEPGPLNLWSAPSGGAKRPEPMKARKKRGSEHGTCGRHRPRHHEFLRQRSRRRRAHRRRQRGGFPDDPVHRRLRAQRRGARRRGREASGGDQPGPDHPLGQAGNGIQLVHRHRRQEVHPAGDLGAGAHEAQARLRGLPRRAGHRRGDHRPGLLQRRPAPGHQGGRRDRGLQRPAHRQRAHRRGPRARAPRSRPSWSSTSAAAPSTSPCWNWARA